MKTENQIPIEQFIALDQKCQAHGFTASEWARSSCMAVARISELRRNIKEPGSAKRALTAKKWAALAVGLQKLIVGKNCPPRVGK